MNRSIERRRELLDILNPAPKDPVRLSPLLQAHQDKSLRRCVSSVWKVWPGNESIPSMNQASDRARVDQAPREHGTGTPVSSLEPADSTPCWLASTRERTSSSSRRSKTNLCRGSGTSCFPLSRRSDCPVPVQESAREEGIVVGRVVNRGEDGPMPLGQIEAGLPSRIRRTDRRSALASLKPTGRPQRHINRELLPSSFPSVSLVEQFRMRRGSDLSSRKRGLGSCFLVEVNCLAAALKALW